MKKLLLSFIVLFIFQLSVANEIDLDRIVSSNTTEKLENSETKPKEANFNKLSDYLVPDTPTLFRYTKVRKWHVELEWAAASNAVSYEIYQDDVLRETVSNTTYIAVNLIEDTNYTFKVRAKSSTNDFSAFTPIIHVRTGLYPKEEEGFVVYPYSYRAEVAGNAAITNEFGLEERKVSDRDIDGDDLQNQGEYSKAVRYYTNGSGKNAWIQTRTSGAGRRYYDYNTYDRLGNQTGTGWLSKNPESSVTGFTVSGNQLKYRTNGTTQVVYTASGFINGSPNLMPTAESRFSDDMRYVALEAYKSGNPNTWCIVLDLIDPLNPIKISEIELDTEVDEGYVAPDASGQFIIWYSTSGSTKGNRFLVRNNDATQSDTGWGNVSLGFTGHGDFGYTMQGNSCWVGFDSGKISMKIFEGPKAGTAIDLMQGNLWNTAIRHASGTMYDNKGWMMMNYEGKLSGWPPNETDNTVAYRTIFAVQLDEYTPERGEDPLIRKYARTMWSGNKNSGMNVFPNPSRDGKKVTFNNYLATNSTTYSFPNLYVAERKNNHGDEIPYNAEVEILVNGISKEVSSYTSQDAGQFAISGTGTTLELTGNSWKKVDLNYLITPSTVLEFEFNATLAGEIHGIGFDDDTNVNFAGSTEEVFFKLYGSQDVIWDNTDFNDYSSGAGWKQYTIPVGNYIQGEKQYMVFFGDKDTNPTLQSSSFRNITIVSDTPVTNVNVTPVTLNMNIGDTSAITATVIPSDATDQNVSWSSSDTAVLTVDASGLVSAIALGSATVTATTNDGSFTASTNITVLSGAPIVSNITVSDITETSFTVSWNLDEGSKGRIEYGTSSGNYTEQTNSEENFLTYHIQNVGNNNAPPLQSGTTYYWSIRTEDIDGNVGYSDEQITTTNNTPVTDVNVSPVTLNMNIGDISAITATVIPSDATDQNISWSSSDTTVVTVDASGLVSAIASGSATITATTNDGGFTALTNITVLSSAPIVSNITVSDITETSFKVSWNLDEGSKGRIEYGTSSGNYTEQTNSEENFLTYHLQTVGNNNAPPLQPGTTYYWRIRTEDIEGNVGYSDEQVTTTNNTPPQTVTFDPIHDAYLQGSTRYNSTLLRVEEGNRITYMKYDLGSVNGTITSVELHFRIGSDEGVGTMEVYKGTTTNWTETTLSSSNKPLEVGLLGSTTEIEVEFADVVVPLIFTNLSGVSDLSLIVKHVGGNDFSMVSQEDTTAPGPQLVVTFIPNSGSSLKVRADFKSGSAIDRAALLYPNPTTNTVRVHGVDGEKEIMILDFSGKILRKATSQETEPVLDLSTYAPGIYYMKVKTTKTSRVFKIVKQ